MCLVWCVPTILRSPCWLSRISFSPLTFTQVPLYDCLALWPGRDASRRGLVAGITLFPFWGPGGNFRLHPAGQFLGRVEKLLKCQILRLFLAVAGPCLCLSERHRREDLPWTVRKRPSHHLGCQAILPSSRTLAHTNFFKIKNYVFYWTWSAPFNPLSIGLYVCSLHPLCLAWW